MTHAFNKLNDGCRCVQGYAERKVLLLCDVVGVCKKLHNEGVRKERLAALKATRTVSYTLGCSALVGPPLPKVQPVSKFVTGKH